MTAEQGRSAATSPPTPEHERLAGAGDDNPWRLWGPYLAGRQWGTVREDYSADGDAWTYLPFEQAHRRAYRWGEDGLGGFCDRFGFLNVALALWNGQDRQLKERLFGLTNGEGNHGEDVKEYWWALDGTPTHSYASWLYRYPQAAYPYEQLRDANRARGKDEREYELADTGVLAENRFFDVTLTYAKAAADDLTLAIDVTNQGPDAAPLHVLPQVWFRNTWVWGRDSRKPTIRALTAESGSGAGTRAVLCSHVVLGDYVLTAEGAPELLMCENETDAVALFGVSANATPYTKDAIDNRVVHGDESAVNPEGVGTKAAFWYRFDAIAPGATVRLRLRLSARKTAPTTASTPADVFADFDAVQQARAAEADAFYEVVLPQRLDDEDRTIARRAFAGLLWNKQLYRYDVSVWLEGDPAEPAPPPQRANAGSRNVDWQHLALADVISMPDEWEYPWFAAWDLAFHCVALAHVDPAFAKNQLLLMCREWAMHPNGQLPAYEWSFGDVNPPVHAWAAWQVYLTDGAQDSDFLIRIFTKLLLDFGWWVNRKDSDGSYLFEGGFLGMDNIGLFNRSAPLPEGTRLEESDATSWVAFFCLGMFRIALELAGEVTAWDEVGTTFLEHFLAIAEAVRNFGAAGVGIWDESDGFCYDQLVHPDGSCERLAVRSMVGLLPLLAVAHLPADALRAAPDVSERLAWLQFRRPDLTVALVAGADGDSLLSLLSPDQVQRVLVRLFDENEFLSPGGVRSLSAAYRTPYSTVVDGQELSIDYEPGESRSGLFGGNSNWRGPVWFPVNVLLADALRVYDEFFGAQRTVEVPAGSGTAMTLAEAAEEIDRRLISLFRRGPDGRRRADGNRIEASDDPLWRDHVTFSEYFDGDTGEGLGASHQTGWTALVAALLCRPDETGNSA